MLLGRFEWAVGLVATAVVVTIVSWYAVVWSRGGLSGAEPSAPPAAQVPEVARPAGPVAPRRDVPTVRRADYRFVAVRGDAWLQVREGSHRGRILYEGTLAKGGALRLRGARLWVRFGASAHVNLHVDGRLVPLPLFGTYDAFVTPRGVRPDPALHEPAQAAVAQSP